MTAKIRSVEIINVSMLPTASPDTPDVCARCGRALADGSLMLGLRPRIPWSLVAAAERRRVSPGLRRLIMEHLQIDAISSSSVADAANCEVIASTVMAPRIGLVNCGLVREDDAAAVEMSTEAAREP